MNASPVSLSNHDMLVILPVLIVIGGAFIVLLLDAFVAAQRKVWVLSTAIAVLALAAAANCVLFGLQASVFEGMFVRDGVSNLLDNAIFVVAGLSLIYGWNDQSSQSFQGEVPVLVLFACAGMLGLVSAGSLLVAYLGLELLALCSYALVASRRDSGLSAEAAMKYFLLGSLASGLLLYGMSLIYGATQRLDLAAIAQILPTSPHTTLIQLGVLMAIAGVAFKLGAAPFHMYLPDVYQGAPPAVALFISAAPKLAAFGFIYRLLWIGLAPLSGHWHHTIATLAAVSLVVGNVMALMQADFRRMLAYSTVSHIGFMLIGVASANPSGFASALLYAIVYAMMTTGVFGALLLGSKSVSLDKPIGDYQGLAKRDPWLAACYLCFLLSMTGVPPFLGFWAKYSVISAALRAGLTGLAGLALVSAVVAACYYLRIAQLMYFHSAPKPVGRSDPSPRLQWVLRLHAASLLFFGLACQGLIAWCQRALAL